ncbi:NAD-dependent epimerase/dehydratase family protein [Pseudarthrobacter sp. NamE5]|uniref:NAD-dependent epimerase/dehydratase family protein n=1 Tax=Pseudarthrobacter sp. NamE5 TaxID=2576839 RepID=UPI00110B94ED|nr:NAD-dependent epimerase/dehydratase family protein [Pseudarthrobacter sp. NamE5]TLM87446.1 epimerase [Pseudarthrobacter sp. NamE5]
MRILVLGGTAFLSAEIVRQAVAAGHQVTCLARGSAAEPPAGAVWLKADRASGGIAYAGAGGEWDEVVDVARDPVPAIQALEALSDRAAHWTFVSSCSVYADASVPGAAEEAALLPQLAPGQPSTPENYGESKVAIEEATLRAAAGKAHLCRAGLIGGPGDGSDRYGYWPGRFARDGLPVIVPAIDNSPVQVIDVRDLAAWILLAAGRQLAGPANALGEQVAFGAYIAASRAAAGHEGEALPAEADWLADQGVGYWAGQDSLPLWLPPAHGGFMARSNRAAVGAGLQLRPWQETLADTLADERRRGLDRPRKAGLTPETEAKLVALLRAGA